MRKWKPYTNTRDDSAWFDLANMVPTSYGTYRPGCLYATSGTAAAGPATPGTTLEAWCGADASGVAALYVGTTTKLYKCTTFSSGSFSDYSRTVGGAYAATSSYRWSFASFGNVIIACNYVDATQYLASGAASFENLTGSPPKAQIAVVQSNAVVLFAYDDGTAYGDGWWASDVGDHTTWTPAATNDAANGRILSRPGKIYAAAAFGGEIIAFKATSIHRLRYVGAPTYWEVDLVVDGWGVESQDSIAVCGNFIVCNHARLGPFVFNGQGVVPLGDGMDQYASTPAVTAGGGAANHSNYYPSSGHVVFYSNSGVGNAMVYNVKSDAWGKTAGFYDTSANLLSGFVHVGGTPQARYSAMGATQFNAGDSTNSNFGNAIVNLSANPCIRVDKQRQGASYVTTWISTGYIGDEDGMTNFSRVTPMLTNAGNNVYTNASMTCEVFTYTVPTNYSIISASQTPVATVNSSGDLRRFDFNYTARFARFRLAILGDTEIMDVKVKMKSAGTD